METVRLDDYVSQFPLARVDFVKLDVEGGELEVLQGASRVLTKFRPIFICEVLDATTQAWGYKAREIIQMLERFDFAWFDIRSNGLSFLTRSGNTTRKSETMLRCRKKSA